MENSWQFFKKLNMALLYGLASPVLGIYPKELEAGSQTDTCTPVFIVAQFTMANLSVHQQVKEQTRCVTDIQQNTIRPETE